MLHDDETIEITYHIINCYHSYSPLVGREDMYRHINAKTTLVVVELPDLSLDGGRIIPFSTGKHTRKTQSNHYMLRHLQRIVDNIGDDSSKCSKVVRKGEKTSRKL